MRAGRWGQSAIRGALVRGRFREVFLFIFLLTDFALCQEIQIAHPTPAVVVGLPGDLDGDGLSDDEEQDLAEKFAPIVIHTEGEKNFPTNVDEFLKQTKLCYFDSANGVKITEGPKIDAQVELQGYSVTEDGQVICDSRRSLSVSKKRAVFLSDVDPAFRGGSAQDSTKWTTYFHAYPNAFGGVTIQYWRFYAYNSGKTAADLLQELFPNEWSSVTSGLKGAIVKTAAQSIEAGFHGGDWEGVQVVLDNNRAPILARYLGHSEIKEIPWAATPKKNSDQNRILVYSEPGSHTSRPLARPSLAEQETRTGGRVSWVSGEVTNTGPLLNLGEKTAPLNGQYFIQYAGLWGSPSTFEFPLLRDISPFLYNKIRSISSGYWGPTYNETGKESPEIKAWAGDMNDTLKQRTVEELIESKATEELE